jgi:hypothetical protein
MAKRARAAPEAAYAAVKRGPAARPAMRATAAQRHYLALGLDQPGGKLPLFDRDGREIDRKTVESCVEKGWAEPWFANPIKPGWLVCRMTEAGRAIVAGTER